MMKFILNILILFLLFTGFSNAGIISAPPNLPDEPAEEQRYLREIYNNFHIIEITTSDPNGSRNGKKGQIILYNNAGTYSLKVNTNASTTWQTL